jgi:hypothetical protein
VLVPHLPSLPYRHSRPVYPLQCPADPASGVRGVAAEGSVGLQRMGAGVP